MHKYHFSCNQEFVIFTLENRIEACAMLNFYRPTLRRDGNFQGARACAAPITCTSRSRARLRLRLRLRLRQHPARLSEDTLARLCCPGELEQGP